MQAERKQEESPESGEVRSSNDIINSFGADLARIANEQISLREPIEQRWLEDMRRYQGEAETNNTKITETENSSRPNHVANRTRQKAQSGEARIGDLLFPNDDKNYGIKATRVPELVEQTKDKTPVEVDGQEFQDDDGNVITEGSIAARKIEIAEQRAGKMADEIDDQLSEANYALESRDAIHYATKLGTGILKGPIVYNQTRKVWLQNPKTKQLELQSHESKKPGVKSIMPWNFFPDMSARRVNDAEFILERSFPTKKQIRMLMRSKGFLQEQVSTLLTLDPKSTHIGHTDHINQLRELSGLNQINDDKRYELWEYHGPISKEVLAAAGTITNEEMDDPLYEVDGVVWFSGTTVLKVRINPMETEDWPYSVWCWEEDESGIFGYGIPYLGRNSQKIMNDAWSSMMEQAEKGSGPQIVMKKKGLSPANGKWEVEGFKLWYDENKVGEVDHHFRIYEFPNHQQAFQNILEMASQLMDEEVNLPMLAQGEQGTASPTLGGMAMLMNAATSVLRRQVKRWDDDVTTEMIGRFYHWNMQFNPKQEIKGDYEVEARGSSTLLVKEIMSQNLMAILQNYSTHPVLGELLKAPEAFRKLVQSLHISPDEIIKSNDELQEEQPKEGEEGPEQNPEMMKLQIMEKVENAKLQLKNRELEMMISNQASDERIAVMKLDIEKERMIARLEEINIRERAAMAKFKTEIKVKVAQGSGI